MNDLLHNQLSEAAGTVECLGQTFASDNARREHFLKLLAEKLQDPAFRKQEGFPQGTDEAILAMSDPPYYTACPNPWLAEFVAHYGKPYDPAVKYSREPLAIDVSVGKTDAIYKAHSYHTKVPHLAIVPSILHYTQPGDVVLDGFAGSGMTGVAAQWCGTAPASYRHELELTWKKEGRAAPKWGARRAVLNDLSPAATFIGANYNIPFDVDAFAKAGKKLLKAVEQDIGWMYETLHSDGKTKGRIEYTVWSEVFSCPECAGTVNFLDEALEDESKRVREVFPCPHCGAELNKDRLERVLETRTDPATGQSWQRVKFTPSIISYVVGKTRHEKTPDAADLATLAKIEALPLPASVPTSRFPIEDMYHGSRIAPKGFTHVHHFYLPRAAQAMGALWAKARAHPDARIRAFLTYMVEQAIWTATLLNRYRPTGFSQVNQYLTGVYYVASQHAECSPWYILDGKLDRLAKTFQAFKSASNVAVTTGTAASLPLADDSVDYIFTDPPFGENIYYADLNFLVEAWHGVTTDAKPEAIIDKFKHKALPEYQHLMQHCFAEYQRVLKPGRWMTVVFSNSKAAVWNAIQVALQQAGFVVAEVTALDKVQGSYRQVTSTTAVKQDLVISAYKPNGGLEDRFKKSGATVESAWDFVKTHLKNLPVTKHKKSGELDAVAERNPRRIYDRMVAWFVRHDAPVPLSSPEFLADMFTGHFAERDGMAFLPEQVAEYDKKRMQAAQAPQVEMWVDDERSAIDWLADFLKTRPSTYADVHPEFIKQLGAGWKKHETRPELSSLLEANFLRYDGVGEVPSQIHRYLSTNYHDLRSLEKGDPRLIAKAVDRWYVPDPNKAQDLEKKREKALLKEFETYKAFTGRKIKESRLEVLRAGFRAAWATKDYATILAIAQKLPDETLQEDEKLLTLYDMALTRSEDGA
ncbi:DNA methyltransferase [Xanthomonas citri pv. malvacearum]|uniref:DNA methylase n=1 Tax=Xanthomonas campestris pv. malvacearum TaxID=86040 RepID=A0AA45BVT2_XANCM|nr:DNA methyltransferase [Xanthomonas citri]ASM99835.1 DNA methylase [Xanthomonas citri pv. malvacearum]ASN08027.1 DNA methylase [Xanthomonas citri pv. malvacearum]ASY83201.1 DNA methylase [Xanthomonas citri pv. malvacearum]MCC4629014.1 DNA methylase [Xanthomonas citri]NMI13103.1 DNA methylase [Xanthomonas citri]